MDNDPEEYFRSVPAKIQASIRKDDSSEATGSDVDEKQALEVLLKVLQTRGIDLNLSELRKRLSLDATEIPSPDPPADLEAGTNEDIDSNTDTNGTPDRRDETNLAAIPKMTYNDLLAKIDSKLDKVDADLRLNIILPPSSYNPFLTSLGSILLQPRASATKEPPVYFKVHKVLLTVHSHRLYAHLQVNKHKHERIFLVDTDKQTLSRVIDWLYYPTDYDLRSLPTDTLLKIIAVAAMLRIAKLHNSIAELLLERHTRRAHLFSYPPAFAPSKRALREVYERSKDGDGIRKLCGYLFTRTGRLHYEAEEDWELAVSRDVERWVEEKGRLGDDWKKVPASEFFLASSRGSTKGREVGSEGAPQTGALMRT